MTDTPVRKIKVNSSFFEKIAGFELPSSLSAYLSKFLSIGMQDYPLVCEMDFDRSLITDSPEQIDIKEIIKFVGKDDVGPMERSLAGRAPNEALYHRESDQLYLCSLIDNSGTNFAFFVHPIEESRFGGDRAYLMYKEGTLDVIIHSLMGAKRLKGEFFYGADAFPIESIMRPEDNRLHFDDDIMDSIRLNSVDFLQSSNLNLYKKFGVQAKRGILLDGAPGSGKTVVCRRILIESVQRGFNSVFLDPQSIRSRRMNFSGIFRFSAKKSPVIIVMDDVDLFFGDRDFSDGQNILGDMLQALDGIQSSEGVVTIATTNHIDRLDSALIRPGRFDVIIKLHAVDTFEKVSAIVSKQMQFPSRISDGVLKRLIGEMPAQIAEFCNRYKLHLLSKGHELQWNPSTFEQVVDLVLIERDIALKVKDQT